MVEDKKYLISESELKEFKAMSVWTHGFAESAEMDPIGKATKDFLKSKTPIEPSDDAIEAEIREILYDFHSTGSTVTPEDFDKAVFQLSTLTPKAQGEVEKGKPSICDEIEIEVNKDDKR